VLIYRGKNTQERGRAQSHRQTQRMKKKKKKRRWGDVPLFSLTQQSCMCKHGRRPVSSLKDFMFRFYDDAYGVMPIMMLYLSFCFSIFLRVRSFFLYHPNVG